MIIFWRVLLGIALFGTLTSTVFLALVLAAARRFRQSAAIKNENTTSAGRPSVAAMLRGVQ